MTARLILAGICLLAVPSCEKVKQAAARAASASAGAPEKKSGMDALVDHTEEGYLFRKDLPFPGRVRSEMRWTNRLKARGLTESIFGKAPLALDGILSCRIGGERNGNEAFEQTYHSVFNATEKQKPTAEKKGPFDFLSKEADKPLKKEEPVAAERVPYRLTRDGWVFAGDKLTASRIPASIITYPNQELAVLGLTERRYWFGPRRLKAGDSIPLEGDHLEMVAGLKGTGSVVITLEGIEKINGHPCGRFAMAGNFDLRMTGAGGEDAVVKMSLSSGRIWLSLLHPVVLKQQMEGVISETHGSPGDRGMRGQGTSAISIEYDWSPIDPQSR